MCSSSLSIDSARMLSLQSIGPRLSNNTWIDTACDTVSAMKSNQCYSSKYLMPLVEEVRVMVDHGSPQILLAMRLRLISMESLR